MYRLFQVILAVSLVGMMLVGPASAAPAGTVVGNGTPLSCNESSFDTALAGGGTITFNCGGPLTILLTSGAHVNHDTTIDGGSAITLTGNLATQLLFVSFGINLSLKNITLDKGFANHNAGGAILNAGNLSLDNVVMQNNVADNVGGAIWTSGPVSIRNSTLKNNSSGKSGGALYEENPRPITIDSSAFTGNTAQDASTGVGGAIALGAGAQLTMTGGSLSGNQAVLDGGALDLAAGARATFLPGSSGGTSFISNSALGYGGAISNNGGTLTLEGADLAFNQTLTDTVAIGYGGAIDDEGAMVVDHSTFNTNQGRFGGAVFVGGVLFNAQANIQHTLFIANTAAQLGGALYANTVTTTVTIEDSNIQFNSASFGGGVSRVNAHLSISKSSITDNTAQNGGGLALSALPNPTDGPYVEVHDSTISGNLSTTGFGGGINNSGLLDLINVTLADNHVPAPLPGAPATTKTLVSAAGVFDTRAGTITRLQNSVLANSSGANCFTDLGVDPPASSGFNYATDTSCSLMGFHDTQGAGLNAMLAPLSHDNSFTSYQMPLPGSPLIDQIPAGCSATDQIHALRNGNCDIGAVEFHGLLPRIYVPLLRK